MGLIILNLQQKKQKHWVRRGIITVLVVLGVALFGAGSYFFHVGMVPGHKSFVKNNQRIEKVIRYTPKKCGLSMPKNNIGQ